MGRRRVKIKGKRKDWEIITLRYRVVGRKKCKSKREMLEKV